MKPFDFNAGGEAARQTVVLLHSSAGSSRQWNALMEVLRPHFDARAVDFHGHGTRPRWQGKRELTLADEVALVEPILREVGSVHLVGHSYGGAVALKVAELHPHAVSSVVAYEPVLFRWLFDFDADSPAAHEAIDIADRLRRSMHYRDYSGAAARFLDYWCGNGTWDAMSAERKQAAAGRMPAVLPHFAALAGDAPTAFGLRRLRAPILLLEGSRTVASTRRIGELLRAELPQAAHERLADMGHMGPITHADEVNRWISSFLGRYVASHRIDMVDQFA